MKIFNTEQIRRLDALTIQNDGIPSIELMERAAQAFCNWFVGQFPDRNKRILVLCGPGNNGGDGLAIARILSKNFYVVDPIILQIGNKHSADNESNLERLKFGETNPVLTVGEKDKFPAFPQDCTIIDAIFGSGLNKSVTGYWADFFQMINELAATRVAVDLPSGMFADKPTVGVSIHADFTFSFEMPKLAFFFPENQQRLGEWT